MAPRAKPSKKSARSSLWKSADEPHFHLVVDDVGDTAGEVDGGDGEGLVHGHDEVAGAEDALLVAERFVEGLAKGDADVLDGVVLVDVEVAGAGEREVEATVAGEELQHVVEEADAGGDFVDTLAIYAEFEGDLGLSGRAIDSAGTFCFR